MYVCRTNQIGCTILNDQISCCKGKWYVRRFDPDTVENGHIYSSELLLNFIFLDTNTFLKKLVDQI